MTLDVATLVDEPLAGSRPVSPVRRPGVPMSLGSIALLLREEREPSRPGFVCWSPSDVPQGKGLASSAAIGVAVLQAVAACLGYTADPRRLALISQQAEQLFAGAPCGTMDQMTAAYGERGHLLLLLCRPAERCARFRFRLHSPSGESTPASVTPSRAPPTAGPVAPRSWARRSSAAEDEYLTALDPSEVDSERLPERMSGGEFLELPRRRHPTRRARSSPRFSTRFARRPSTRSRSRFACVRSRSCLPGRSPASARACWENSCTSRTSATHAVGSAPGAIDELVAAVRPGGLGAGARRCASERRRQRRNGRRPRPPGTRSRSSGRSRRASERASSGARRQVRRGSASGRSRAYRRPGARRHGLRSGPDEPDRGAHRLLGRARSARGDRPRRDRPGEAGTHGDPAPLRGLRRGGRTGL